MAKVRRTKIIIEEVIGEDKGSTKVFVNGDQFKEIDFTDEKKDNKEEKKKTTSTKKKTSSKKSSSTSSKKKATSSKKKTTSSSKKKSTKSKTSSNKKATSTSKKKEENKKEAQETQSTSSVIELPLKEEKQEVQVEEQVSSITTKDSCFAEISVKNEDKIRENAVPTPIEENGVSLLNQKENNKEVIDNPEVIDGEIKATNEVEIKGEKPETLEAEIVEKEEKDEEISASKENEKDSTKNETDASLEEKKLEETPEEENKISEPSKDKDEDNKDIKEDDFDQIEETKDKSNEDTSKETETKEENVSTTYTVVESNDSDSKEDSNKEESKISKLFSTKGLIVGGVILVALLAILIPVSLNLSNQSSNSHLIEISEEDINKNNFISYSAFFDNLESLELDIYDIRSTTTSLQTSLDYSFVNEIYSFELTNELHYVNEEATESSTDKLTYNQNEDNYTLTTTVNGESLNVKDETKTYTKNQAKQMLQEVINDFYSNYLNCNGSSIKALIDDVTTKEESTLTYYYHDEANTYQIRDTSNSLLIVFDQYGIIESADYSHPDWCLPETPSELGINYYTLNLSYTLKTN